MQTFNLAGSWQLRQDNKPPIEGHLPGSTYLDFMANGMPDPFWGDNELTAKDLAHHTYTYTRSFVLTDEFLKAAHIDLVASGLDTLCTLSLNGKPLGKTDNIYRTWRLDAKALLQPGENTITLQIADPYAYIAARQEKDPLPGMMADAKGTAHLRKTPCHFGWDWGPVLPPAGLLHFIELQSYETRIEDLQLMQNHKDGTVTLTITAALAAGDAADCSVTLTAPDGETDVYEMTGEAGSYRCEFEIESPQLWWCNGLGEQPLYHIELTAKQDGKILDSQKRQIGLRTVELDTTPDERGAQFRFIVNGVPIFAKGANWIPADSFITRFTREDMDFYINSAKHANMNMLRVWGGGMYESEDFYDACDKYGILVWQDFIFANSAYPFYETAFLDNLHAEVRDNVRRIRHRASLALWCGNNEMEFTAKMWKKDSRAAKTNLLFYHNTLREWVNELDGTTQYWPGSPSAGSLAYKLQSMKPGEIRGDSHLWQIWHGMLPIEAFRKFPTRFCSEYGMESMPSMHTVGTFTDNPEPNLFDPVMQLHQKSRGGNEKIMFYLLAKYRNPKKFEDFVYLSQLVQANTVRFATDCWRRNIGLQNGSLFWQLNDCWPVASWAGIDYGKQKKAVMYQARHFNQMLCLSNDYFDDRAELYVVNEYNKAFSGTLEWALHDFKGNLINNGALPVSLSPVSSINATVLRYKEILKGYAKEDAALTVKLVQDKQVLDEKHWLLVPDKKAKLPKGALQRDCTVKDGYATVTLYSQTYARYVYLEADGVTAPWSDNFFDIPAGESVTVSVKLPEGMTAKELQKKLRVKTLADVEPKNSRLMDKWLRFSMVLRKKNFLTWFIFKFFL